MTTYEPGMTFSIDLTALALDKCGSRAVLSKLEDGDQIETSLYGQKLVIETDPTCPEDPYIDLWNGEAMDSTLVVCDGETIQVESINEKGIFARSTDDIFNAIGFSLTQEEADICLNNFA